MADETTILGLDAATQPIVDDAANVWFPGDHDTTTDTTYRFSLAQIKAAAATGGSDTEYNAGNVSGTATIDFAANGNIQKATATGNVTISFTPPAAAGWVTLAIHQDATGNRIITLPTFANGTPIINRGASKVSVIHAYYDGTNYQLASVRAVEAFITDWGANTALANNAPYVQAMIDSGVKTIWIPDGTFKISETITVDEENVVIRGNGSASVIEMTTGNDVAIDFNGGSVSTRLNGCGIIDVWIRGEDYSSTPVEPSGTAQGVGVMVRHCNNFTMQGCLLSHHSGNALYLFSSRMAKITGNFFWNNYWNTAWTYGGGSDIYTAGNDEGLVITDNFLCSNNKLGIFVFSSGEATSITIDGNVIVPVDDNGDVLADGSVLRSHGIGLFYGSTAPSDFEWGRMVVSNNIIHKTRWNGIYVSCDNTSTPDTGGRFLIASNHVARTGIDHQTGDDLLQGAIVFLGGREVQIIGNQIVDYLGYSSTDAGNTGYGAINVYQQTEGCDIHVNGNLIKNTPTNAIYVGGKAGRGSISENVIIGQGDANNTSKRGITVYQTATPRANLTSVTVTAAGDLIGKTSHGLSTGDRVAFSSTANGVDKNKIYYVINPNTNDFQICETPGGTTPVDITSDGSGFTVSDPVRFGGHKITDNRIECWDTAISYQVDSEQFPPTISRNVLINRRIADFAGTGILKVGQELICRDNFCHGFLYGVYISTAITGRKIEDIVIDNNTFDWCGYALRADNDGSGNGLIVACNNTFKESSVRIYTTTATAIVEGMRRGNGNIEAWLGAAPTFGTWSQGDIIKNYAWTTGTDPVDWFKTDAGTELFSDCTFTARVAG